MILIICNEGALLTKGLLCDKGINMKIGNVHISILAQKEGDNSAIVTSAKCALLYYFIIKIRVT